jgi:HlyD family secretion protein
MARTTQKVHVRLAPEAIAFQPDAVAIEVEPPPWKAKLTLWVILLSFVGAVVWSALAEIDRIVVAPGKLITREPLIVLQPLETAIIRYLNVQVGDRVRAGQVLVELDPTFTGADMVASRGELGSLDAQIARLYAELAGERTIADNGNIPPESLRIERQLLDDRVTEARARLDAFQSRERRSRAELDQSSEIEAILKKRGKNIDDIVGMRSALIEKGGSSRLQLILAQNEYLSIEQELAQLMVRRRTLDEEIQTVLAEREAFNKERRRQATEQLIEAQRQRERMLNTLTKSERRGALVSLLAPADAIVFERARLSVGSVAQSAQALLVLVPVGAMLEGEVEIPSKDIALVQTGDKVAVKIEAFPFQRYGTLEGQLLSIAPDANQKPANEGGAVSYKAKIELAAQRLATVPRDLGLAPGMVVTGEIISGKRTVLSYLLYPVLRALNEGMREP